MWNPWRLSPWRIAIMLVAVPLMTCRVDGEDVSKPRSLEEIRAEVEGLRKQDVAWREIDWKTCLIDGLQESKRTHRPLMLWIFIDRPIDDERC
jgi:hypothetical protein